MYILHMEIDHFLILVYPVAAEQEFPNCLFYIITLKGFLKQNFIV